MRATEHSRKKSMPKDFAGRGRTDTRKRAKRKPNKRVSPKQRVLFHGPSFSSGALVGATIVILTAYGPEMLQDNDPQPGNSVAPVQEQPRVQFDFPDLLKNMEVKPDPEPYAVPKRKADGIASTYSIQAASFRDRNDAEKLRASLLLEGLPAKTSYSEVNGSRWYRVAVGPFIKRVEADRAITRLREQKLSPIWINNHN